MKNNDNAIPEQDVTLHTDMPDAQDIKDEAGTSDMPNAQGDTAPCANDTPCADCANKPCTACEAECDADTPSGDGDDEKPADPLAELVALILEKENKYMRLAAEYDNFRKRTAKERESLTGFIVRDTAAKFLPVLDSLNLAIAQGGDEATAAGLVLIDRSMTAVLTSIGIEEITDTDTFDPNLHNAVMHIDDPSLPENSVVEVLQKGYKYNDIVIRHAMVKVAN